MPGLSLTPRDPSSHLEDVLAADVLVPRGHVGTLAVEGVVLAIEGLVVRVAVAFAHAVTALLGIDATISLAHEAGRAEAAGHASALTLQASSVVVQVLTRLFAGCTEAVLVPLAWSALLVCRTTLVK